MAITDVAGYLSQPSRFTIRRRNSSPKDEETPTNNVKLIEDQDIVSFTPLTFYSVPTDIRVKTKTNKTIVLDLDETLVHTISTGDDFNTVAVLQSLNIFDDPKYLDLRKRIYRFTLRDAMGAKGSGNKDIFWGITRPHVEDFLIFCFSYFSKVIVWSAGVKPYVEKIVDFLFQGLPRPNLVLTRKDLPKGRHDKPLEVVFSHSEAEGSNLTNTLIIDDKKSVFATPNPSNGIRIPEYIPSPTIISLSADDIALQQISQWFLTPEIMNAKDVRLVSKDNIFRIPVR